MDLLHADHNYNMNNFSQKVIFKLAFGEIQTQLFMTKTTEIITNLI